MRLCMLLICAVVSSLRFVTSAPAPLCPRQSKPSFIVDTIRSQCPLSFSKISPREVNGDLFERAISSKRGNVYTSVLFYASWCPFSYSVRMNFEFLSSLYPQIEHLAVEQSSVMPSVFSRYGIHSLPAMLIVNGTSRLRYHGSKDLGSLILFYMRTTEYEPVPYVANGKNDPDPFVSASLSDRSESRGKFIMQSWIGLSARELLKRETYLVYAVFFLFLRLVVYAFPRVLHHVRGIWVSYAPHLSLQIFGETSQTLGRVVHMMDVKRIWTKLRLCKSRNFHLGARNARVWASSLASVSLGETRSSLKGRICDCSVSLNQRRTNFSTAGTRTL